jgi:hypothetical protein
LIVTAPEDSAGAALLSGTDDAGIFVGADDGRLSTGSAGDAGLEGFPARQPIATMDTIKMTTAKYMFCFMLYSLLTKVNDGNRLRCDYFFIIAKNIQKFFRFLEL